MKALVVVILLGFGINVSAQKISWFTIEGTDYYQVSNCPIGSSAAFYSSVHGGRVLSTSPISQDGTVTVRGNKSFQPQMVLNTGNGGNNRVAFTGKREFTLVSLAVQGSGKIAAITWGGAATDQTDISFQVLKSIDGMHYQTVTAIPAHIGDAIMPYVYTEAWSGAAVLYKVSVISKATGARFVTQPMLLAGLSSITVFPTATNDNIYISLPAVTTGAGYSIVNSEGKKVEEGGLIDVRSSISLAKLPAGNYIVTVHSGAEQKATKLIKL